MNKYQLIASMIPTGVRVVDVGCGSGKLGRTLVGKCCEVVGVDVSQPERQQVTYVELLALNVEEPQAWDHPALAEADAYVFSDVLEHLRYPERVLAQARERLRPGGRVIVSLPNVANWQVRLMLLRGRWDYTSSGIMDQTHLRFFTRRTGEALCVGAGFQVVRCEVPTFVPAGAPEWLAKLAQRVARSLLPELFAEGFVWELVPGTERAVL